MTTPLRHGELAILLALSRGHAHGYQIRTQLAPVCPMGLPTLYKTLHRLAGRGLIEYIGDVLGVHGGPPQRHYYITRAGQETVRADVARMRALLALDAAA